MHVALVHMRHARTGGTERHLDQLAACLAERGHRVTVVCRSHAEPPHAAVRFETLRPLALGGAWRLWSFARAVERHLARARYDLVMGLGKTWSQDVLRLGGGCHATYLERAHLETLLPWELALGWGTVKQRLALQIERRALAPGAFRALIVNSAMVQRDASARYAIPLERIRVIHNEVDLARFHPRLRATEGAALRAELGLAEDALAVLFLGTGYGRKGLDRLLAAFPEVLRAVPKARLLVAGYDSAARVWRRRAESLGLGGRALFLGGRSDAERCFAAADVYALPTRYDPFANTTLEALASGLPVVTSDANGAAELLLEGLEGTVLPSDAPPGRLAEALVSWSDPELRARGAAAARRLAERHGSGTAATTTALVLEELVPTPVEAR